MKNKWKNFIYSLMNKKKILIDIFFVLLLFGGVAILTRQALRGTHVLIDGHYFLKMFPGYLKAGQTIRNLEWPLWNPYLQGGMPMLADNENAALYPLTWLYGILPPSIACNAFTIFHLALSGFFMYFFCRSLGFYPFVSFFCACIFQFTGCIIQSINFSFAQSYGYLPAFLIILNKLWHKPDLRIMVLASGIFALGFYAGHPQIWVSALMIASLYFIYHAWLLSEQSGKTLQLGVGLVLLGTLLSSLQILPSIELFNKSTRSSEVCSWEGVSFPTLLVHLVFNWNQFFEMEFETIYIGLVPACLAIFTLFIKERQREILFWWFIALMGISLGMGDHTPFHYLFKYIPLFNHFTTPSRYLYIVPFSLSILSGFALQSYMSTKSEVPDSVSQVQWQNLKIFILFFGCIVASHLEKGKIIYPAMHGFSIPPIFLSFTVIAVGLQTILLLYLIMRHGKSKVISIGLFFLLLSNYSYVFQFSTWRWASILGGSYSEYFWTGYDPSHPVLKWIKNREKSAQILPRIAPFMKNQLELWESFNMHPTIGNWQVLASRLLMANVSQNFNLYNAVAMQSAYRLVHTELVGLVPNATGSIYDPEVLSPQTCVLPLFNAKYLLMQRWEDHPLVLKYLQDPVWQKEYEDELVSVYERKDVLPRFWFVQHVIFDPLPEDEYDYVRKLLFDGFIGAERFNPRLMAIIHERIPPNWRWPSSAQVLEVLYYKNNAFALKVNVKGERGFLVASETYYPGWEAVIDDQKTHLYRTNFLLRGCFVPQGEHTVIFRYRPRSVRIGLCLTLLALIFSASLLLYAYKKKKK